MTVDIRQVAAEAGVSTATVSRVLSGRGPASSRRASAAVRKAALDLGYLPSATASCLRTDRSMIIGVVVPNLANPVFLPFLRAVEHRAQRHGYAVIVADTQRSPVVERRQLDRLSAQRVDALILAGRPMDPDHVGALSDAGLPVSIRPRSPRRSAVPCARWPKRPSPPPAPIWPRWVTGGWSSSDPRRRIPGRGGSPVAVDRVIGAIELDSSTHVVLGGSDPGGTDPVSLSGSLAALVRSPAGPTTVWSNSHLLAPRLLEGLAVAGVGIPEECSFITFGDSPWATAYRPSITVIDTDLEAAASAMTAVVLRRLGVDETRATGRRPGRHLPAEGQCRAGT